ncbi:M17 family metallopeptidase [Mycoplasmopsis gallinarum]|uniref:Probable cytosol aminopeptidase n=1 Tax=Mycoplasmopsis gallinarum TaxID=29557 RepID=A0A162QHV5_9BACT|nr:peptidase M17 [Mycoplasmopsis gallinarum]OAB48700.1 Cytosol aminopeptidase PepA [Mycoplasmopsis gallinarum]
MNKLEFLTKRDNNFLLVAVDYNNLPFEWISKKNGAISENLSKNEAYITIKEIKNYGELVEFIKKNILNSQRAFQIDLNSFKNVLNINYEDILKAFISSIVFYQAKLFNKKKEESKKTNFSLLFNSDEDKEFFNKFNLIAENRNKIRNLQIMPENYCNSVELANYIVEDFSNLKNLKVTVLDKNMIEKLKMGLILSVNKGSTHEPRVVIVEYNGNKKSKDKIVFVGKGITFDTGGINTKGYHMSGMKYDMSGSAIVAYVVKTLAELKANVNVAAIMMITDNRQDGDASLPENVYESMSGLSVEVTDTDAEGRLVLADGLYYGATKLKATTLVDVATLTGSVLTALGHTYSGIWSTNEEKWGLFEKAGQISHEKIWRMPLHDDFHQFNLASEVADLNNYNNSEKSDSNTAAMFLKQFTNNVDYIHCDVAGTADVAGKPQGVLIDTLVEFALLNEK